MAHALTDPAVVSGGSPVAPRGILASATPAPEGWETGGIQTSTTCPSPIVRDKCISFDAEPGRPTVEEFPAFMVEQGSACSTLSGDARMQEARDALAASTDFALGVTLLTGEANGGPSLSDADEMPGAGDIVAAVSQIEAQAAEEASGMAYVLHATPAAAAYLASSKLIDDTGRAPSGAPWIISAGYGSELRIWATGRVWAAVGAIDTLEAIDRRTNNREAWAVRSAIVGFNTCLNLTVTFPPTTGGGGMPGPAGASAYEIAVENGFEGTEEEWLESLIGPQGPEGPEGPEGPQGPPGEDGQDGAVGADGAPGTDGADGAPGADGVDGVVQSIIGGDNVTVDDEDPANPIINFTTPE